LRRKLDDPKRPGVLVPVTTFHKFLRYSASRLGSVSPGVWCYSGFSLQKKRARSPGSLQVIWPLVERAQQYGAICAPELSYCGMQPGSCGPANDAVAALSASAAPNPRAPRYLMTRVFMVVLHSSECVKAEEREGVVRSAAAPSRGSAVTQVFLAIAGHLPVMMRAGRSGMQSSPKQAPI